MKPTLAPAAVGEAATGLVLLVYPPIVVEPLFGAQIAESAAAGPAGSCGRLLPSMSS
jgi:hypothetical protein